MCVPCVCVSGVLGGGSRANALSSPLLQTGADVYNNCSLVSAKPPHTYIAFYDDADYTISPVRRQISKALHCTAGCQSLAARQLS